jgi:23S rRNA (pseudouridine1915-N3)-methyltransferase
MLLLRIVHIVTVVCIGMMVSAFYVARSAPKLCVTGIPGNYHKAGTARFLTTNIIAVGKRNGGEEWISSGCAEYEKRLRPVLTMNTIFLKTDDELVNAASSAKGTIIALDERGKQHSSQDFTNILYDGFLEGGSTVTFLIGGFAGLPQQIRNKYPLISLSKLTWTHSMARLLLIEQIYRATEIRKGSSYHKD